MKTITNRENCLLYGLPGIVMLGISLLISVRIGNDFGGNTFVSTVSFVGCNGLLWLVYLIIFQYLPEDVEKSGRFLIRKIRSKLNETVEEKTDKNTAKSLTQETQVKTAAEEKAESASESEDNPESEQKSEPEQESESESEPEHESKPEPQSVSQADAMPEEEPTSKPQTESVSKPLTEPISKEETEQENAPEPLPQLTSEEYNAYCTEFQQRNDDKKRELATSIMNYVNRIMAPFMTEEELPKLCNEINGWCMDPEYKPAPISLKYITNIKDRLKTLDLKHFIWNIGERLGADNGYTGIVRSRFIKNLFPDALQDAEVISLQRTLTIEPGKGHIKLDRPVPDCHDFHL